MAGTINVGVWVQQYFIHIITRRNCSEKNSIVAVIFTLIVSMFLSSRNIVYATEDKARAITIHMQGLSDEAYYVDLLVKIKTSDPVYTDFNSKMPK